MSWEVAHDVDDEDERKVRKIRGACVRTCTGIIHFPFGYVYTYCMYVFYVHVIYESRAFYVCSIHGQP